MGSSLVAVAHTIATGTSLQLFIFRLLLPLAGCALGDRDAGYLGALGWSSGSARAGMSDQPPPGPCGIRLAPLTCCTSSTTTRSLASSGESSSKQRSTSVGDTASIEWEGKKTRWKRFLITWG